MGEMEDYLKHMGNTGHVEIIDEKNIGNGGNT